MKSNSRIFYLANSCHICKAPDTFVSCEICHMVYYCTEEHRRQHWQIHSHLCRALFKLSQQRKASHVYEIAHGMTSEQFRALRHQTASECLQYLSRPLNSWELEILYYPKTCGVCFLMHPEELTPCVDCGFIFTCSKNHFHKAHSKWCSTLKTYCNIIRYLSNNNPPIIPDIPLKEIPESMSQIMRLMEDNAILHCFASELLTYPLTVLSAVRSLAPADTLTIHIIGSELQAEVLPFWKWETFLLHFLPQCQAMSIVFIGPDLQDDDPSYGETRICPECRDTGRKIQYKLVPHTLYHEYMRNNGASKPDITVSLNNGIYRSIGFQGIDSWRPTLEVLFSPASPPLLLTEYTMCEINQDVEIIQQRFPSAKIIQPAALNPFASTKPSLNVISDEEVPVIFKNFFSMVVGSGAV